ncbi:MAG: hypothetical protein NBV67_04890 [Tagaea sp.]|nr:hypothetical protein [Tagaea sp.]
MSGVIAHGFTAVGGMAQYDGADWSLQVERKNGISLDEAYAYAYANDAVTYFFRVDDGAQMVLTKHGVFRSGDTVFFSGNWWLGTAPGLATSYKKNARAINYVIPPGNYFTRLRGKMNVPTSNPASGILFLWPGLQPGNPSNNSADAIGNGVLQPVLTFDAGVDSCAPNPTNVDCSQRWWISGQYVNTDFTPTTPPQFKNCHGGDRMLLQSGAVVDIDMAYDASSMTWTQTCESAGSSVTYAKALTIDNQVQNQSWLLFINEPYGGAAIVGAISMYDLMLTTVSPCPQLLSYLQSRPQVTGARQGSDTNTILVDRIVFHSPQS